MNLDKKYFSFLKKLISMEEEEENEEIRQIFLNLTASDKELRGKALLNMTLQEKHFSPAGHPLASFTRSHKVALPLFSLDVGNIVSLFPGKNIKISGDKYPSGTVYEKSKEVLTVAFNGSLPEWVLEGETYDLHKSVNRVTYRSMRETLDAMSETTNTRLADFRDISLKDKKAGFLAADKIDIQWFDNSLNASQKLAVKKFFQNKDIFLIHGPPGTGKTTVIIEIIRQCIAKGEALFITAPSNTACDNILERLVEKDIPALRLGHPARISAALREHTLDFKLALHPLGKTLRDHAGDLERLFKKKDRRREITALKDEMTQLKKEIYKRVMQSAQVIVGTPTSVRDKSIRYQNFDCVIIDEATQATEPMTWIPIVSAKKVAMAGDHFQLPPTVRSKAAQEQGLGLTLFERFYDILSEDSKQLLELQYRMNEKIMGFSSKYFYKNLLLADESVRLQTLADLDTVAKNEDTKSPFLFIDTAGKGFEESLEPGSESRFNFEEARLVLSQLSNMLSYGVVPESIAVISPYSAQVRLLASQSPHPDIEIDSVDGFQGREKELVILSLVRSNMEGELGFLNDTRRMNVAMTRARRKLIAIGDSATLSKLKFYKDFITYAESIGGYKSVWEI